VHPVRALLAFGSACARIVAHRLAYLAPVAPGWNHHRGRVLLDSRFAISPRTLAGTQALPILSRVVNSTRLASGGRPLAGAWRR